MNDPLRHLSPTGVRTKPTWTRDGVGHLLECAGQVSGGYFADPGVKDVPNLANLGFPLAEVEGDGSAVITKLPGTGGRVDRMTVTEQLTYEVTDPAAYLTPDVTLDMRWVSAGCGCRG